jgi:hydrocephalus-inducing protein
MTQNTVVPARLSTENLGRFTSELTLITQEYKVPKTVRGSVMLPKGKADSHFTGSQKQHHQHQSETPQVQVRRDPWKEGWESFLPLHSILRPGQHPVAALHHSFRN